MIELEDDEEALVVVLPEPAFAEGLLELEAEDPQLAKSTASKIEAPPVGFTRPANVLREKIVRPRAILDTSWVGRLASHRECICRTEHLQRIASGINFCTVLFVNICPITKICIPGSLRLSGNQGISLAYANFEISTIHKL